MFEESIDRIQRKKQLKISNHCFRSRSPKTGSGYPGTGSPWPGREASPHDLSDLPEKQEDSRNYKQTTA